MGGRAGGRAGGRVDRWAGGWVGGVHGGVSGTSLASVLHDTLSPNPPFHPPPTLLPRIHTAAVMCTAPPVLPAEYRISVYGRKPVEWDILAAWVIQNRLYSDNNMWMFQVGVLPICTHCNIISIGLWVWI